MPLTNAKICSNMAKADWLFAKLAEKPLWTFDTETTGANFLVDSIFCISFSWVSGLGVCIDFRDFSPEEQVIIWTRLKELFLNNSRKVAQNGVFDVKFLWKRNISVHNWYADTILMAHLLNENEHVGLGPLAHRYTDMGGYHDELDKYVVDHPECDPSRVLIGDTWKKRKDAEKAGETIEISGSYTRIPKDMLDPYACQDADVTLRVFQAMFPLIQKEDLTWILFNIQMPIQKILARVEYSGISVDREYLEKLYLEYKEKMGIAWTKVLQIPEVQEMQYENQGKFYAKWKSSKILRQKYGVEEYVDKHKKDWEFKASTKQLEELIIGKLGQKPIKFGKTSKAGIAKPSMDAAVLAHYALIVPQVEVIQEHRTLQHLNGTFIEGMLKRIGKDGRIRSNYPLFRTVTGRVASNDPNLNNIPRKAVEIKHQFIADPGCYIVEADYSQAEFRHWAAYSQDPQMLYDIKQGIDIHKLTAAMGKGVRIPRDNISLDDFREWTKDITKEERNIAKTIVFGVMYGRGPRAVARALKITEKEARNIIAMFFGRYPIARQWLIDTTNRAKIDGYVRNLYGRKRRLIYINRKDDEAFKEMAAKAERMAQNAPIQGGASDTTFLAAIRIDNEMLKRHMKSRLILTVYDSIDYNVIPEEVIDMLTIIHTEMLRETSFVKVKLDCEISIGRVWGKLEEVHFTDDHQPKLDDVEILKPT